MEFNTIEEFEEYSKQYLNGIYFDGNDLFSIMEIIPKIKKNYKKVSTGLFSSKKLEQPDTYELKHFVIKIIGDVIKNRTYTINPDDFHYMNKCYWRASGILSQISYLLNLNETLTINNIKLK